MKIRPNLAAVLLVLVTTTFAATSKVNTVQFYNPLSEPLQRFNGDLDPMMKFIAGLNATTQIYLGLEGYTAPAIVHMVVGLPAEGRSRVWLLDWDVVLPAEKQQALVKQLEVLPAPKPIGGTVAFVLTIELCGATVPKDLKPGAPPIPEEWKRAIGTAGKPLALPDGLPGSIWGVRESAPSPQPTGPYVVGRERYAPEGYEVRNLGSKGGQIIIPKGWFYRTGQTPNGPAYSISKENSDRYETGMRIQVVARIKATAGLTPREAVEMNIARKKRLEQLVDECPPAKSGMFWRICLETISAPNQATPTKKFHLKYSFWWNDDADMMLASTFGAPEEDWPEAQKIYAVIKDFKLIDLDRVPTHPAMSPEPEAATAEGPSGATAPGAAGSIKPRP